MPKTTAADLKSATLMDVSRYTGECRAMDACWDALVDGFIVTATPEQGVWVVRMYKNERHSL